MNCLKFAAEHVICTEEQWDCVHFSDESKFNLFGCDVILRGTKSSVKFGGGSVMVFGMIPASGAGYTVKLTQL